MATHTFDRGGSDDNGTLDVSLFTYYGEERVWTDIEPGVSCFGLTADQARAYAADLITHANALDERNASISTAHVSNPLDLTADDAIAGIGVGTPVPATVLARLPSGTRTAKAPKPRTVVVTKHPAVFQHWCWENNRNPRDRTIIRIYDLHSAEMKLMGIGDFELVVLGEVPDHNQVMALISYRMATARREDPSH